MKVCQKLRHWYCLIVTNRLWHTLNTLALLLLFSCLQAQTLEPQLWPRTPTATLDTALLFGAVRSTPAVASQALAPPNYTVNAGDGLFIGIYSQTYTSYQLTVTPEGKIILPRVGELEVKNLTIPELKARLTAMLSKTYKRAEVSVALVSLRSFEVEILGETLYPTKVRVSAAERISDALAKSGVVLRTASLRQITLRRSNPDTTMQLDLLPYYRLLETRDNHYLREGDVIFLTRRVDSIRVVGEVRYPGSYEFHPSDSLYRAIAFAGGVLESAYLDSVEIIRYTDDRLSRKSLFVSIKGFPSNANVPLQRGDIVVVRRIPKIFPEETVELRGEVRFPGIYRIEPKKTRLLDVIQAAGGFTKEASLEEAAIIRPSAARTLDPKAFVSDNPDDDDAQYLKARMRERPGKMSVNFKTLMQEKVESENIVLEPNDIIEVPRFQNYINVIGRVIEPGNVEYQPNLTIKDYIALAGGLGKRADEGRISVIKPNTGDVIEASKVKVIEPGDTILVPELPRKTWLQSAWEIFRDGVVVIGSIATTTLVILTIIRGQ
ncbi:MAG: SLBB domain-containing protein [Chloroherpetonaceae bacterium]|nr:SLBB domain-containing protein [Chloroherpetonaceae bacterium]